MEHRSGDIRDALYVLDDNNNLSTMYFCCRVSETTGTGRGRRRRDGAAGAPQVKERTRQGQERGRGLWKDVRYITD